MKRWLWVAGVLLLVAALAGIPVKGRAEPDSIAFRVSGLDLDAYYDHGESIHVFYTVHAYDGDGDGIRPHFDEIYFKATYDGKTLFDVHDFISAGSGGTTGFSAGGADFQVSNADPDTVPVTITASALYEGNMLGSVERSVILKVNHVYGAGVYTNPTCQSDGYTSFPCSICGVATREYAFGTKLGHLWDSWAHVDTTSGFSSRHTHTCYQTPGFPHSEMANCYFTAGDTTPATCTQGASTTHTCYTCYYGFTVTDTQIDPANHLYGGWAHDEATSGVSATHTRVCERDPSHSETELCGFPPIGVVTDPTCMAGGYTTHTCGVCQYSYQDAQTEALPHLWGASTHIAGTQGVDSMHTHTCAGNGTQAHSETLPCAFGPGVVTDPTCTQGGYTTHTCGGCGYSYRDVLTDPAGHLYGAWAHDAGTSGTNATHTHVCANDPTHTETLPCDFTDVVTPPTCDAWGYITYTCVDCGFDYTDVTFSPLGHWYGGWAHDAGTQGAAATHTHVCARDAQHTETLPCDFTDVVTPPTCTAAGFTTHTCRKCAYSYVDAPTAPLGHLPGEWEITLAPTGYREGERVRHCTCCGALLDTEAIPKLNGWLYNNTACAFGPRFRDEVPELTDLWYMYAPVDFTQKGEQEWPLVASGRFRIGTVKALVGDGSVRVWYELFSKETVVKEEFLAFFPALSDVVTVNPEEMAEKGMPLRVDIPLKDVFGGGNTGLLFLHLVVDYDIYGPGVEAV